MVAVIVSALGGSTRQYTFNRETKLREIQKQLCTDFGQRFPSTKAVLVLDKVRFDEFEDTPFVNCRDNADFNIVFIPTDDTYFLDYQDRRVPRVTLADEVEWEAAVEAGSTLSLAQFIYERM